MHFLNDKFFRLTVIAFFIFMALPFMFSTPEPEKKDEAPVLEFTDKNLVYKIVDRIAKFYGFKKEKSKKEFSFPKEQINSIKKQMEEKEKQQEIKQEVKQQEKALSSALDTNKENSVPGTEPAKQNLNYRQEQKNSYINLNGQTYQILTNEKGQKYILTEKGPLVLKFAPPAKSRKNMQGLERENKYQEENKDLSLSSETEQKTTDQNQYAFKTVQTPKESFFDNKKTAKGSFGQNYFSAKNKPAKEFSSIFDNSLKDIRNIKQSQKGKEQNKAARSVIITYKAEVFNPSSSKREIVSLQKQIIQEDVKNAQNIKQITAQTLAQKEYNEQVFKYKGEEISFPNSQDISLLDMSPSGAPIPPHTILSSMSEDTDLTEGFNKSYTFANTQLPAQVTDYPSLEFIYKTEKENVLRVPNNSDDFNIKAVKAVLADKISIPTDREINFLKPKESIYVVPEEELYKEYQKMGIPVIYYPQLSPANLGKLYETAIPAIEQFNLNKKQQKAKEQSQNKAEIETILKN